MATTFAALLIITLGFVGNMVQSNSIAICINSAFGINKFVWTKGITPYRIIILIFIVLRSFLEVKLVWDFADMFNGMMVIPNLIALLILAPQASAIVKDYDTMFIRE